MTDRKQYKGRYRPANPQKYVGNLNDIVYRSLWERKFMVYCDTNPNVLKWASEEIKIPYISPLDRQYHTYYPDFMMVVKTKQNTEQKYLIEIKPKKFTTLPKAPKRKTKSYINEVYQYAVNESKWKFATQWCEKRNIIFKIFTEDDLNIK